MKVLITGATGLIGTELVALLLKNKFEVSYLTTSKAKIYESLNFKGFYWDPSQNYIDKKAFQGVDVIVHLAGAPIANRWTHKNKIEILESRVGTAQLLFDYLKDNPHQVKQFISASAIGIYPDSFENVYSEDSLEKGLNFLSDVVEKWEQSADEFQVLGIKVCKIRTGLVLSNKEGVLVEMMKPVKMGFGSGFGSGKQMQSWIHISDLVQVYFSAIKNSWEGTFNGVAPHPVTNQELMKTIALKMGKPFMMPNVPKWLMKMILGEMHVLLFLSQNVSAKKVMSFGFKFKYEFLNEALDDLIR